MKTAKVPPKLRILALIFGSLCLCAQGASAQTVEPQHEQLLNGLRVLLWTRPGDQTVVLKLRIHRGAVFDIVGKGGTMALLGDILFPDAATHEYFTGEMGGRLEVDTDYDTITITLQGRAREYDRIVDVLRGALVATPLTAENVARVREARIKKLSEIQPSAAGIADLAIAHRLLGAFPYAHPIGGTADSLRRVDRADLMLARDRFMNSDNATLAIVGGVDQRTAMRALRQLLGGWRKSDQVVPATFRQPDPPDKRTLIVNYQGQPLAEVRLATRGLARSDKDFLAESLLAHLARERWRTSIQSPGAASFFARAEGYILPGMFVMGGSVDAAAAARTLEGAYAVIRSLITTPASATELQMIKSTSFEPASQTSDAMIAAWLDIDTYGLVSISEQRRIRDTISAADLQRVAERLFRENSIASVIVGNEEALKAEFAADKIQLVGSAVPGNRAQDQLSPGKADPSSKTATPAGVVPAVRNNGAATRPD